MKLPKEIETERLVMRPVAPGYEKEINRELNDEVTRYMYISPEPVESTYEWVKRSIEKREAGTDYAVQIFLKNTDELIGGGGLHHVDTKMPEFGIWLKKSAQGHKYGREAVMGLYDWVKNNLDYDYLVYPVDRNNIPSRKIAEAMGGVVVGEEKKDCPSGKVLDTVIYHIGDTKK